MTDAPAQHSALDARDDLLAIAAAWPDLEDRLGREGGGPSDGMPRAVTPTRGLVINEHISEIMREVREWVAFLGRQLVDETDWRTTSTHTGDILTDIARNRIGFFTAHQDEQMQHAFHDDAKHYRRVVTQAAYPDGYRTLDTRIPCEHVYNPECTCRGMDETPGCQHNQPCTGTYKVRPDGQRMPDLVCSVDRTHRLDPGVWSRVSWQNKTGAA